jgi:diguanylate cyclase (GGDEF)-like protein
MISLKEYLDSVPETKDRKPTGEQDLAAVAIEVYRALLQEMGNCSLEACPAMGDGLKRRLDDLTASLSQEMEAGLLARTEDQVRQELSGWGRGTAKHYQQKTSEVKSLLLSMVRTAESVSARDEHCAGQMNVVTDRLKAIASLDDLTEVRSAIETGAAELKASIGRMVAEGKEAVEKLRGQVAEYQVKLDEAEAIAARDALTGLSSRLHMEGQIEKRIAAKAVFCVALIDIDGFKLANDEYGHLAGDELLKQFGKELRSACRASDVIGRWGGDEFIVLLDCRLQDAESQAGRLRKWICGDYTIRTKHGDLKLRLDASIGLAAYESGEPTEQLVARADAAMYAEKAAHKAECQSQCQSDRMGPRATVKRAS